MLMEAAHVLQGLHDWALELLTHLQGLEELSLSGMRDVTGEGLMPLTRLPKLKVMPWIYFICSCRLHIQQPDPAHKTNRACMLHSSAKQIEELPPGFQSVSTAENCPGCPLPELLHSRH